MPRALLSELLLPPGGLILLGFAALLLLPPRWGRAVAAALLAAVLVLGMPMTSGMLLASLDPGPGTPAAEPQAIVILSGDVARLPDPHVLDPGPLTLERLRAGAALHRRTGLPILVSGGRMPPARMPLAEMMAISLARDFQLPVQWREEASRNTRENAEMTAALLREAGVERVLLVTHAWHMRRSLMVFRQFGLQTTPAPVRPQPWPRGWFGDFIPQPSGWQGSHHALHEWVGIAFYRLLG